MSEQNTGSVAPIETATNETSETSGNTNQANEVSNESPAEKQVQSLKKKFTLKVDGEEFEEEIDFSNDEEIKRHLQMSKAAQKRMREASDSRKQAEQVLRMIKENPVEAISKLGGNFRELAEQYLLKQIEEETLTPEQKKVRQAEEILRSHEEQKKMQKEQEEHSRMSQLEAHYSAQTEKTIAEALQSSNLPKSPATVKRMAQLMYQNLQMGLDLDAKTLAQMTRESYVQEINELFGSTEGDQIVQLLGDGISNKIRKYDIDRLKKSQLQPQSHKAPSRDEAPKQMGRDEWREFIRKKAQS